jgi:hypothetical protein
MSGIEVYHSIQREANKESGMNNKPHDQWTNTERDHYNIIHEKIKTRTVNTFLKNATKTDGKDQDIYKVFGHRVIYQTQLFPSGYSTAANFHCHSAFIIDNHEEIQELKKQLAVVVDNREEIQELRRELVVMRSELASLKAASVLDDIDDDEDEIEQPVTPKEACESLQEFIRACEPKVSAKIKKKRALGISADAREHSDRHYEQVCKDWLS